MKFRIFYVGRQLKQGNFDLWQTQSHGGFQFWRFFRWFYQKAKQFQKEIAFIWKFLNYPRSAKKETQKTLLINNLNSQSVKHKLCITKLQITRYLQYDSLADVSKNRIRLIDMFVIEVPNSINEKKQENFFPYPKLKFLKWKKYHLWFWSICWGEMAEKLAIFRIYLLLVTKI